jgi:hypothetical protein
MFTMVEEAMRVMQEHQNLKTKKLGERRGVYDKNG